MCVCGRERERCACVVGGGGGSLPGVREKTHKNIATVAIMPRRDFSERATIDSC
jgi:hypothetical protein